MQGVLLSTRAAIDESRYPTKITLMPTCKACGEEVDELTTVTVQGKRKKLCEECAEDAEQQESMAEASEAAVQQMMGFKGRR